MIPIDFILLLKGIFAGAVLSFISITSDIYTAGYVLSRNWKTGFIAALGITLTHILWSVISLFVLHLSLRTLHADFRDFIFIGSAILIVMAIRLYRRGKNHLKNLPARPKKLVYVWLESVLFGLGSPGKIIAYAAVFITIGIESPEPKAPGYVSLICGVLIGAVAWWLLYLFTINSGRKRVSQTLISKMQKIAACFLFATALYGIAFAIFY